MVEIECYEKLCTAVVKQGVYDYKKALERLRHYPNDSNALHVKEECERFFRRDMEMYSDLDGEMLIRNIQERVREGSKGRWTKTF